MSVRMTNRPHIRARNQAFDLLFEEAREYTKEQYGKVGDPNGGVLAGLRQLYDEFKNRP